jgi:hypothetical protein
MVRNMTRKYKPLTLISALLLALLLSTACKVGSRQNLTIPFVLVQLGLSDGYYDFSGVVRGNYAEKNFIITNTGTKDGLEVTGFTSSNPDTYKLDSENCTGQSLVRGASCNFNVRFTPAANGPFPGTIAIASNNILPSSVVLSGEGCDFNVWISGANFSNCNDVQVNVMATDLAGNTVDLNKSSLRLWRNNPWPWPADEITISSVDTINNADPISMVFALDLSSSLTHDIATIKLNAKDLINNLHDYDEAAINKFKVDLCNYPTSSLLATTAPTNKDALKDFIDATTCPSNEGTALFDAIYDSITRVATYGTKTKKAVVVLSDGDDQNSTTHTMAQVIAYAKSLNIPIFTIFYVDPDFANLAKPQYMHQMAIQTGGLDYYTDTTTSMTSIFTQIKNLLGSTYVIRYNAGSSCSGSVSLKVKAVNVLDANQYGIHSRTFQ